MATRYNAFGWYNPYAPVSGGGVVNGGQQPLRGLVVPTTSELAWRAEPDLNRGFPEVRNEGKLYAAAPQMAATTTTTTTTTNGANNQATSPTSSDQLNSVEKSRFRGVGIALCILASFTLGVVVSYFAVDVNNACLANKRTSTGSLEQFYYWAPRVAPIPMAIFAFVIGILAVVIRDRAGGQARTIYALSIFSFVLLLPLLAAGGIGGVLEAKDCITGIGIVYLVLPSILLLMFLIFFGLIVYVMVLLIRAKPVTTATVAPTSTTTSVTMTTTPVQPPSTQPPPTQQPPQPPQQPFILQVPGPAYQPPQPYQPYQYVVRRYPQPRPPPVFGAAPYRRSPYGYNGYSPFQPMRPSYY